MAAGGDLSLKVFVIDISQPEGLSLKYNSEITKESVHRTLQIAYDAKKALLTCLSTDNKLEAFKVNIDKPDAILKKLMKKEKKKEQKKKSELKAEAKSGETLPIDK